MPSADFGGVVGVEPDPEMAVAYLRGWHGSLPRAESRLISVLCLPSRWCLTLPLGGLIGQIERSGLAELVYGGEGLGGGSGAQSVYVSAGTLAVNPGRGKRGGKKDSGLAAGCWADLDVGAEGSGRFAGWGEVARAVEWFDAAGIGPTVVVGSGSGGAHLYWHVEGGLEPADAEVFGRRVRLWLEQRSGLVLDRVENSDRVLRLPGSVRWPKQGGDGGDSAGLCVVVREWNGRWVSREGIERVTGEVWADWAGRTQAVRDGDLRKVRGALSGLADLRLGPGGGGAFGMDWEEGNPWGALWAMAWAEDMFAESIGWDEILTPAGWRRNGVPDAEGRQEWCRPGGGEHSGRSLVVDWMGSPHVASLLSLAPETGLLGLEAAGAALTKARVAAELHWGGDLAGLMGSFLSRRRAGLSGFGKGAGEA